MKEKSIISKVTRYSAITTETTSGADAVVVVVAIDSSSDNSRHHFITGSTVFVAYGQYEIKFNNIQFIQIGKTKTKPKS